MKLLVANRGEIAIRIIRGAAELGLGTVAVAPADDSASLHVVKADESVELQGTSTAAYLDIDQIIAAATDTGCDAIHPGYGFLAENAELARRCIDAGLTFVGPSPEMLELFGDKARARKAAVDANVPVIRGIDHAVSLAEAEAFFKALGDGRDMMIKAAHGGGGRGSRMVESADDVAATYERCRSEAELAFGNGDVYVEEFIREARHVEVQILGDQAGNIVHLYERECSVQRRFQKIIEIAPAPALDAGLRDQILDASVRFAGQVGYTNAGTFEFLVDSSSSDQPFAFIEANARLQVEHTVSEEVTGVDVVQTQLRIAQGESLKDMGLTDDNLSPRGYAIQARVCMESVREDGSINPEAGVLTAYSAPSGPGVRTDGFGYAGYETSLMFDSLLAKVIGHSPSPNFADAISRTSRALAEFHIEGVDTNIGFLQTILQHPDFATGDVHTRFVDEHLMELANADAQPQFVPDANLGHGSDLDGFAGARVQDSTDPLALFNHDTQTKSEQFDEKDYGPVTVRASMPGTILSVSIKSGDTVTASQPLAVIETLEVRHTIKADVSGQIQSVRARQGTSTKAGDALFVVQPDPDAEETDQYVANIADGELIRADLDEVYERRRYIDDEYRSARIDKRHDKQQRSPAENIEHLMDGTFREYGPLVTAASWQKQEWLRETTQADGLVMGIGKINGDHFDDHASRSIVVHYDYMVVAGTQGGRGHYKQDRMYELAKRFRMPLILFAEGGGGRPGISGGEPAESQDIATEVGLKRADRGGAGSAAAAVDLAGRGGGGVPTDSYTFTKLCELSGLVPLVGLNSGRCFAGNTVMLASCDVIIAAENSTIGLGGPAMIEGGGLGIYTPEEVGPMSFQVPNGVVDILVKDDKAVIETAKQYLSYFQGSLNQWETPDQHQLRHVVPEDRTATYDMRDVIRTIADEDSILEIREKFGLSIITAFMRVEGKPLGVIANNPQHLSGAIDGDSSDKGARFLQLCDAFDIPVLSLMDCPGAMPGPEYEKAALLRHISRLFVTGANMTTPMFGVVIRKAYGMGVRAMCGGSSLEPFFTVAWPTAEFAETTLESRIKLAFGDELDAIEDAEERARVYDRLMTAHVDRVKAVNSGGTNYGIDDVIDPAHTRAWIAQGLESVPTPPQRTTKKRPNIDTW